MLVVSDTSDRTHLAQKPSRARGSVGVSDSTITSFSWLLIEIDTNIRKRGSYTVSTGVVTSRRLSGVSVSRH